MFLDYTGINFILFSSRNIVNNGYIFMKKNLIKLLVGLILLFPLFSITSGTDNGLKIYAVRYGKSLFQNKFMFYGDKSGGTTPFSWMFYYIEYNGKKILVDTGFNDIKAVKLFSITDFKDPVSILNDNGIKPEEITDIIITHSHFDHIGNVNYFKNARIIINKDELAELKKNKTLKRIRNFLEGNPKVVPFDKETVLYDIFTIRKIGGHTKGSSVVFFSQGKDKYCFTGDEVYMMDNIEKNIGNGSVFSHGNNTSFIKYIRNGNYRLFIFHDRRFVEKKERFIRVLPPE